MFFVQESKLKTLWLPCKPPGVGTGTAWREGDKHLFRQSGATFKRWLTKLYQDRNNPPLNSRLYPHRDTSMVATVEQLEQRIDRAKRERSQTWYDIDLDFNQIKLKDPATPASWRTRRRIRSACRWGVIHRMPMIPMSMDVESSTPKLYQVPKNISDVLSWIAQTHGKSFRKIARKPRWCWSPTSTLMLSKAPWVTAVALESWSTELQALVIGAAIHDETTEYGFQGAYTSNMFCSDRRDDLLDIWLTVNGVALPMDETRPEIRLRDRLNPGYEILENWVRTL